ncbi:MAG: hypothetical protein AAGU75_07890 [Bacillota bacterium]
MNYVKYNRSFVMMEEQSNQFASKESAPIKGYLKVETGNNKGAIRCAVQNLRYFEKGDYIYKLILFGKKGERTIHTIIGNLMINRQGNGETYFRFQPLDIDGKGNTYHNYTTAIIAAASTKNDKEPLHPVLKGVTFSEGEPFQSELTPVDQKAANGKNREIDEIMSRIDKIVEEVQEVLDTDSSPETVKRAEETLEQILKDKQEDDFLKDQLEQGQRHAAEELTENEYIEEPFRREAAADPAERPVAKKTYNDFYNEYVLNSCAHTCRVAEFYEDVTPFDKDKTGARWKKIVNITNLPLVSPGAHYFATQYHHYLFGAKADEKGMATKFYFGIPGRFLDEEQPDGGKSGFTYWQPIRGAAPVFEGYRKGERASRNVYGYWIVAVDARTGNIEDI